MDCSSNNLVTSPLSGIVSRPSGDAVFVNRSLKGSGHNKQEGVMDTFKDFNDGLKIFNDLDNRKEGPHHDIMTDLRKEIGGIEKVRIDQNENIMNGETVIGPIKMPW
jgi:hypothetical protein